MRLLIFSTCSANSCFRVWTSWCAGVLVQNGMCIGLLATPQQGYMVTRLDGVAVQWWGNGAIAHDRGANLDGDGAGANRYHLANGRLLRLFVPEGVDHVFVPHASQ